LVNVAIIAATSPSAFPAKDSTRAPAFSATFVLALAAATTYLIASKLTVTSSPSESV
jgi:hypothetical protein